MGQPVIKSIRCPIRAAASSDPDRTALTDNRQSLTYAQLDAAINGAVKYIQQRGIASGDVVAVLDSNSNSYAILFHAAFRLGFILMPLNTRLTKSEWQQQMEDAGCRLLIAGDQFPRGKQFSDIESYSWEEIVSDHHPTESKASKEELSLDREAMIIFSSGSSGASRGVILTWKNLYYSAVGAEAALGYSSGDSWLATLPFFHIGGISILFRAALAGCGVHIFDKFRQDKILEIIDSKRGPCLSVVPTMLRALISADNDHRLNDLKAIIVGGAPMDESLRRKCKDLNLPILTTYGMTETSSMVTLLPINHLRDKISTAGIVLPHRKIKIAEPGEDGPILVRGEVLFSRYLNQTDPVVDSQGWFNTGDIGRIDNDGYLTVTGRAGRFIISGGENIDLNQIEQAITALDGITGAVVLSRKDKKWGERPVAIVQVADDRMTENQIKGRLDKTLAQIKIPDRIVIVHKLPLTGSGKYDRQALHDKYSKIIEEEN